MSYLEDFPVLPEKVTGSHSIVHVPSTMDCRGGGRSVFLGLAKGKDPGSALPTASPGFWPTPWEEMIRTWIT